MAQGHYDFTPIRNTATALLKRFGKSAPVLLLRDVNTAVTDPTKPWRGAPSTVRRYPFIASVLTLGFPKRSDPILDKDVNVIAPGDMISTLELPEMQPSAGIGLNMSVVLSAGNLQAGAGIGVSMTAVLFTASVCGPPTTTDRLYIEGQYYSILGVQDLSPDALPIIFTMRCRAWPTLNKQAQPGAPY